MDRSAGTVGGELSGHRPPAERARVLLEINNQIVSHLDLAQVLKGVSECLRREIKHDFAGLALYDAERHELRLHALDFPEDQSFMEKGQLIPLVGTPASLAFSSRKPVLRHRPDVEEFPAEIMKRAYARGIRSGCAVPLLCHDKIVGSMVIASLRESAFTEDDAELMAQIASQVAIAVNNAQNFEKARLAQQLVTQERDRTKLLLEINNAVVLHLDLRELLKSISASLHRIIHHDAAFLTLCDPDGKKLRVQALDVKTPDTGQFDESIVLPMDATPEGEAIRLGRPVLIVRQEELVRFSDFAVQESKKSGIHSGCAVPLIVHGHRLGALSAVSFREAAFSEEDAKLLEQCSAQIAIAVQNSLNFESAREAERQTGLERDRSKLLLEVNNAVVSHLDLSELLSCISARLNAVMPVDSAFIGLSQANGTELLVQALDLGRMQDVEFARGLLIPIEGTPEQKAIVSGAPVVVDSVEELERFSSKWVHYAVEHGVKSGCFLPLNAHGQTLGALGVVSLREHAFNPDDAILLAQISSQIAIAVSNALNFENSRRAESEVRQERDRSKLLLDINNALVSHLDLSDLVKAISRSLQHVIQHDCAALAIYDADTGKLFSQAVTSELEPMSEGVYYSPEGTISGETFLTGGPVYVARPDAARFPSPVTQGFFNRGLKTLYSVPIGVHGRTIGVMSLSSVREDAFTAADRELFRQVANQVALAAANAIAVGELAALKDKLAQEKLYLEDEIRTELNFDEIVGQSPALRQVLKLVETVASSDSTVLLLGETGTGKELIARAVHSHSRRKSRTFVKLNCAAIPTGLLESELFGHEKGAFTGAIAQKIGRLELADQGTLFLDEVGDIPPEIQPKLLRALQEREFERLGSTFTKKVNVRLVAATNRDLEKMTETREFRSDLYYRLNVFPIRIPPLRERPEDIPLLVRYFVEKCSRQMQKRIETIPAETMNRLQNWHWPGNVRELENLMERAVILSSGSTLQVPLPDVSQASIGMAKSAPAPASDGADRAIIIRILRETRGILAGPNGAASRLGLKRTTLQYKIKKMGIAKEEWWPTSP